LEEIGGGQSRTYLNLFLVFLIGGLWHGAAWTFVVWGALHGVAIVIHRCWQKLNFKLNKIIAWIITFNFVNFTWIFFRAKSFEDAMKVIRGMFFGEFKIDVNYLEIFFVVLAFLVVLLFKNSMQMAFDKKFKFTIWQIFAASFFLFISILAIRLVNFYTLDFKKKIFLCLSLVVFAMVGLDVVLYVFAESRTSKTNFVDNKISKAEHFKINSEKQKDIVFVGSSRTFNHISTNIFKENNIGIYNFGVSGNFIGDYPFIVNAIKKVGAKEVVVSIRVSDLFKDYIERDVKIYTTDELMANFGTNKITFLKTLPDYLASLHLFLRYSEAIYNRVIMTYGKFTPKTATNVNNFSVENFFNIEANSDCELINTSEVNSNFTKDKKIIVAKCSNGDNILFANTIPRENYGKVIELKELNLNTLKYMQNYIIDPLVKNGIKVIILLEPMFDGMRLQYSINEIISAIKNAKIVDLTNLKFGDEELSDWEHLNYLGRKRYSEFLVKLYLNGGL